MRDDQLREHFDQWAQPLRTAAPPALPVIRQRARKRTAGLTAVSGLAAAGAAAAVALSGFPWAGAAPSGMTAAPGVPPRYAVTLAHDIGGRPASVLDMTTGKVVGKVATPVTNSDFEWVAASGDGRTFVLADESQALVYRFYLLHLAADGKPGRLTQLNVPPLHASQVYGMALTADASRLAVAWQPNPVGPVSSHVSVTTLATGVTRTWTSAQGGALDVSWAGDRTVAFDWQDTGQQARSGVRLLDTAAPGNDLLNSRLLISAGTRTGTLSSPGNALITQDGSTVFATMGADDKDAVVSFAAGSGKLKAVLTPAVPAGPSPAYCGILWADPHGRHVILQCNTVQASVEDGRSTPIRLHQLIPAPATGFANTFAW
jgi:hypothetical protein